MPKLATATPTTPSRYLEFSNPLARLVMRVAETSDLDGVDRGDLEWLARWAEDNGLTLETDGIEAQVEAGVEAEVAEASRDFRETFERLESVA